MVSCHASAELAALTLVRFVDRLTRVCADVFEARPLIPCGCESKVTEDAPSS